MLTWRFILQRKQTSRINSKVIKKAITKRFFIENCISKKLQLSSIRLFTESYTLMFKTLITICCHYLMSLLAFFSRLFISLCHKSTFPNKTILRSPVSLMWPIAISLCPSPCGVHHSLTILRVLLRLNYKSNCYNF